MHYLDEGSGETIIMFHGNPTWSFYYRNLIISLRDRYRCIVPDHIGCGYSDKPGIDRYDYSLKSRIENLTTLLDSISLPEKVTLICHDWGGMIGMNWAAQHRDKIKRLVFLNTAAFGLPEFKPFPFRLWLGRNTALGAWLILKRNYFCIHAANIGVKRKPLDPKVRDWLLKPYNTVENRIAVLKFVQTIPLKDRDEGFDIVQATANSLKHFQTIPTLICWGMKDFIFDLHFLREWEKRMPNAEIHRFPDCGHYILEDARDEVIPLIDRFLAKNQ